MLEIFTFIVAVVLLVLPVVDWYVAYTLYKAYKSSNTDNIAIKERGRVAGILAMATTLSAWMALVRLLDLHPGNAATLIVLSIILLLIGLPNVYWLYLYSSNRLRK